MLPEKIRLLEVAIGDAEHTGQLLKTSTYEFRYLDADPEQAALLLCASNRGRIGIQDDGLAGVRGVERNSALTSIAFRPEGDLSSAAPSSGSEHDFVPDLPLRRHGRPES